MPKKANDFSLVREISIHEFESIILWFLKSYSIKQDHISLLGGEPPLHSQLFDLVSLLESHQLKFGFISNISVESFIVSKASQSESLAALLVNSDYPTNQEQLFLKNFEILC